MLAVPETPTLLKPHEAAALAGVDPDTVARWANEGRLRYQKTAGGHRRYRREDIEKLLEPRRAS